MFISTKLNIESHLFYQRVHGEWLLLLHCSMSMNYYNMSMNISVYGKRISRVAGNPFGVNPFVVHNKNGIIINIYNMFAAFKSDVAPCIAFSFQLILKSRLVSAKQIILQEKVRFLHCTYFLGRTHKISNTFSP